MTDEDPTTWRSRSLRPFANGQTPAWMNGIFYPLVVAVLCAVVVVLQGLREDMVEIKVKVSAVEKWVDQQQDQQRQRDSQRSRLLQWTPPEREAPPP